MAAILYGIVSFLLQKVVIQAVVYAVLYGFVTVVLSFMSQYMFSGDGGIASALTSLSGSLTIQGQQVNYISFCYYLLTYFLIPQWLQTVLVAYATVFLIRRLPFIG